MKKKTMQDIFWIIFLIGLLLFFLSLGLDAKRDLKHKNEMHKLNIEKVKLEIQILKKHNHESNTDM